MIEVEYNYVSSDKQRNMDSDDRSIRDREHYLMGRTGYPTPPPAGLSVRDRGCYMMGFNATEMLGAE